MNSSLVNRSLPRPQAPKYWRVAEMLRQQIATGVLQPGDRMPSFVGLRAEHGLSQSTIERIYRLLEQEGLVGREPSRGTFVLEPSRHKRGVIGVSGSGFYLAEQSPYWGPLMSGVRAKSAAMGLNISLIDEPLLDSAVTNGLLICESSIQETRRHIPENLPCVSLLLPVPGMASVLIDDYAGVRQAVRHLIDLGHRRIGYLHVRSEFNDILKQRLNGYRDELQEAGLEVSAQYERFLPGFKAEAVDNLEFVQAGREAMRDWLRDDWRETGLTALIAQNDYSAIGAMEALREFGLRIPEDVSIVGFDGLEVGQLVSPRLTTIEVPLQQIGATAVEMLAAQIAADEVFSEHRVLPVQLRERRSTHGLASSPLIRR